MNKSQHLTNVKYIWCSTLNMEISMVNKYFNNIITEVKIDTN